MKKRFLFLEFLVVFLLFGLALGNKCQNYLDNPDPSPSSKQASQSNRHKLQEFHSHYHLTPSDDSAWASLIPRKMLSEEVESNWAMVYRKMKNPGPFKVPADILQEVSLHNVRLSTNSLQWRAQQTNLEYLLLLNVDNLLWSFRKTAGLPTPGSPYGGWESPSEVLRGHFVGHFLSATAKMWASTHNDTVKERMDAVVSALSECQKKMGTGYLSAFPTKIFDDLENLTPVWAPYYTIHKIMAGLLDQYVIADNAEALRMVKWMVDYFYDRVKNVINKYSVQRHWLTLNDESGGMNDVLYSLYSITNDTKHLVLAQLFDKPCFLGLLAVQSDELSDFHANTHIPVVIGVQRGYEVIGNPLYKEMSEFFLDIVNSSHTYATGGTSQNEHWTDPLRLATTLSDNTEESCTTYNMLKVSRHLFQWSKDISYADYYERALTNGVLPIQRGTEPGVMIYFIPLEPGKSKAQSASLWGTQFNTFWCCYGTAIESFSKLGDSIYFEEKGNVPGLYIIQYVSSSLNWTGGQLFLNQTVDPAVSWDPTLRVTFDVTSNQGAVQASLKLRIPFWTLPNGAKATLNDQTLSLPAPGNYLNVTRKWSTGDKLTLQLPITLRTDHIQDDRPEYASLKAISYGPYLLAGYSSGDWDLKTGSATSFSQWITPVPASHNDNLVTFSQESGDSSIVLTNVDQSITMQDKYFNISGTEDALHATFRIVSSNSSSSKFSSIKHVMGKTVKLEPIDLPGMLLVHQGDGKQLVVKDSSTAGSTAEFQVVAGLDGKLSTLSLESESNKGCFVHNSGSSVELKCSPQSVDDKFKQAASFIMEKGLSQYHPMSFVAQGAKRNFLLAPLLSFTDEHYTVYFNIQS